MGKLSAWIVTAIILPICCAFTDTYAAEQGLVLHYDFEDGLGNVLKDLSGNGNDGTIHGKPEWVSGKLGKALQFDGRGAYVDCGRRKCLNLTDEITIEAWVKGPGGISRFQGIVSKMTKFGRGYSLAQANNRFTFSVGDGKYRYLMSSQRYTDTDWHHVVGVRRSATNYLYVDGVRQKRTNAYRIVDSGQKLVIGSYYSDGDFYYNGTIDHVRIYKRALAENEIIEHYIRRPLAQAAGGGLALVSDARADCTIVTPEPGGHWDIAAAQWLKEYVEKATGANLPIVCEKESPDGTLISIGHTKIARQAGIRTDDLKYDGCKLIVRSNVLYLIGRDTPGLAPKATGRGAGARGTCRAVTKFLEDFLGVRWFVPTSEGVRVPARRSVSVPVDLDMAFTPAFAYGHVKYIYGRPPCPASIANNFRTSMLIRQYGGHSYYHWVPTKTYGTSHPQYFAMIGGHRDPRSNHLCTTNPDVRELFKQALFAEFDKGHDWVACGQTDGYIRCQCPKCEALDNYRAGRALEQNPCERLHLAHKWLADEAKKRYPDRKIHLIAYGPTSTPSRKFDSYGDNVVIELTGKITPKRLQMWKGKSAGLTVYTYLFDTTQPRGLDEGLTPAGASRWLRFLHENGVIGIYGFRAENWGFQGPTYYVLGRMLGDPDLDYKQLVAEYCYGMYDHAAMDMIVFFNLLWSRCCMEAVEGASFRDMQLVRYPPKLLNQLEEKLKQAEQTADSERARNFIQMTRDYLDYNRLLTLAFLAYANYEMNPTAAHWQEAGKAVRAFDEFRDRVVRYDQAYVEQWFPGHNRFANYLTSGGDKRTYYRRWNDCREEVLAKPFRGLAIGYHRSAVREPLTLDFDKPR